MSRRWLAALLAALAAGAGAEPVPAALATPAMHSAKALGAATLAVTRAGQRLVAVGERGTVLLSDDGGARWRQARVPVQASLTSVRFVDERRGWAAGHLGVILHSDDGGETWRKQLDGVQAAAAIARAAANADERTQRMARRFVEEGPDKPFFDIDFADAHRGLAVGAYNLAFATVDGGRTWSPVTERLPNPKGLHLYGVRHAGGKVLIVGEQGLLLRSDDAGATFASQPAAYKGSLFGLIATRSGTLVAYGLRGHALRSADQGASWTRVETGVQASIGSAVELDDGALALLSQGGDLLVSRDDGLTFTRTAPAGGPLPAAGLAPAGSGRLVLASLRGMRRQDAP
jgi:photosystem II stability/assembly factor-like uncharacterized protein